MILSPYPFQHFEPREGRVTIVPNQRAARTAGVPYQTFQTLALKFLIQHRTRVASPLMALYLLRRAVEKETRMVDVEGARAVSCGVRAAASSKSV